MLEGLTAAQTLVLMGALTRTRDLLCKRVRLRIFDIEGNEENNKPCK